MKFALNNAWNSFLKLVRFLFWYGAAVAVLFYLAPLAGLFLEGQYEAMSSTAKFMAVLGFFAVIAAWQIMSQRERLRGVLLEKRDSGVDGNRDYPGFSTPSDTI